MDSIFSPGTFFPLLGFVVVATVTPGPNNFMVLVSGANWGLRPTLPHISGIAFGFPVMIVACGLGLGALFETFPWIHRFLQWIAFAYLVYLSWRIVQSGRPDTSTERGHPLTFFEAAAFQWVNPKAWAIVFGVLALYTTAGGDKVLEITVIALLFGLVCLPNGVVWCLFGGAIAGFLSSDRRRMGFNVAMAALLIVSAIPTLF